MVSAQTAGLPLLLLTLINIHQVQRIDAQDEVEGGEWKVHGTEEYLASAWHFLPEPYIGDIHNFSSARELCQTQGGDLASIHDEVTMEWIKVNVLPPPENWLLSDCENKYAFWVGLIKPTGTACKLCRDGWAWTDEAPYGNSWEKARWDATQPEWYERHAVISGCLGYRWVAMDIRENQSYRVLCMRDTEPPVVTSDFSNLTTVSDGQVSTFSCGAHRTDPRLETFIWQLNGADLPASSSGGSSSELSYRGRLEDQGANLTCTPVWKGQKLDQHSRSTTLQITHVSSDFSGWTIAPEGDLTLFTCSSFGFEPPVSDFIWQLNGVELSGAVNDAPGGERRSQLSYYGQVEDDGGTLTCTPVQDGQQLTHHSQFTTLYILRHNSTDPPSPIVKPYLVTDASINCSETPLDGNCPVFMFKSRNQTTFNVPMGESVFEFNDRIRLDEIRVFLAGLRDAPEEVQLVIGHYGQMMDRNNGEEYSFPTEPGQFLFSYHRNTGLLTKAVCLSEKPNNNFAQLTPFTQWYVKVLKPEKMDLSSVTALEVYFLGTAVYRPLAIDAPATETVAGTDVVELAYGKQGLAELTRGCRGD